MIAHGRPVREHAYDALIASRSSSRRRALGTRYHGCGLGRAAGQLRRRPAPSVGRRSLTQKPLFIAFDIGPAGPEWLARLIRFCAWPISRWESEPRFGPPSHVACATTDRWRLIITIPMAPICLASAPRARGQRRRPQPAGVDRCDAENQSERVARRDRNGHSTEVMEYCIWSPFQRFSSLVLF